MTREGFVLFPATGITYLGNGWLLVTTKHLDKVSYIMSVVESVTRALGMRRFHSVRFRLILFVVAWWMLTNQKKKQKLLFALKFLFLL